MPMAWLTECVHGPPGLCTIPPADHPPGETRGVTRNRSGAFDTLTEWCYWFTIFGEPSADAPWGWQLAGHHIDVHCAIIGHQVVLTPTFLGAEFRSAEIFAEHRASALEFMQSLSAGQRKKAVLYESLSPGELPKALAGHVDGRHRSGAGQDNLVMPYEGLRGDQLSAGQRREATGG